MVGGDRIGSRPARGAPCVMAAPDLVNLSTLIDDAKCFALVRQQRWPEGVRCPTCGGASVVRDGFDDSQPHRQRYRCKEFMGLNLSNRQIAAELGLDGSDAQAMTERLRGGLAAKAPPVRLAGEVEIDEVYVVAGHKGQPAAVAKRGGLDAVADWRERRAAARSRRTSHPSSA